MAGVRVGGAALTITYEPFNNLLGHCAYPLIGQNTVINMVGQRIPLYILFVTCSISRCPRCGSFSGSTPA